MAEKQSSLALTIDELEAQASIANALVLASRSKMELEQSTQQINFIRDNCNHRILEFIEHLDMNTYHSCVVCGTRFTVLLGNKQY